MNDNKVRADTVVPGDIIRFIPQGKTRNVTISVISGDNLAGSIVIWGISTTQGNAHERNYVLPAEVEMIGTER